MRNTAIRLTMALLLGVAVLGWSPLTAGADDRGRADGATAETPAVEAPDAGSGDPIGEEPEWDGDGPAPRPFITTNANNSIGGSLCVGFDCIANESFGFDTLRLKENNLRIHFDDTSNTASFPNRDWRIFINSSANGGPEFFSISDAEAGFDPFRIEGNSLANALTIDAQGDIGLGLRPAALDLHIRRGDTPSIRLEQDGSSGFTPQTFDVAGNEAGFFVRDATSGSTLPFRIRPGAPSSSLDINSDGDVGVGVGGSSVDADFHIRNTSDRARMRFEDTSAGTPSEWEMGTTNNGRFTVSDVSNGTNQMTIDSAGNARFGAAVFWDCDNGCVQLTTGYITGDIDSLQDRLAASEAQNEALADRVAELEALVASLVADAG